MNTYLRHGESSVDTNGFSIITTVSGAFNKEGALVWANAMKRAIERFAGRPFCILIDMQKQVGSTPEAIEVYNTFNTWLNEQPLIAKAYVIASPVLHSITVARLPAVSGQNTRTFLCQEHAQKWLAEEYVKQVQVTSIPFLVTKFGTTAGDE
ncbi:MULTISPECIES: hypothetical protein [Aeromonas]|uniref:hypothetical protein n=1 Tax=Aeromonas TaxID=642 RepID=UPI001CC50130|nr:MULTISPECIES: hypothetical protein [Aeromonas]USP09004.1 hypothetical protein L1S45_17780 [Aeromonas dhakensis]GJC06115.1 hypothetical protein KAM385_31440 [Aeromonas hydrophila]